MKRIKCVISYDGTEFYGYQVQPSKRTVQGELEKALKVLHKGTEIRISASGRTDAGVHAKAQVIHFDTLLTIPIKQWPMALNSLLPNDVAVLSVEEVDQSFHSRFEAKGKEYRYRLYLSRNVDPFKRNYAYHFPYAIDLDAMKKAKEYFIGTHDFTSFCSAKTDMEDKVRTIYEIEFLEEEDEMVFRIRGNGFLYNMVRIIVGTLLEVGIGKRKPEDISTIIEAKDRQLAGKTVPGQGLYLWEVFYLSHFNGSKTSFQDFE